jgi:hypothetical protein
MSDTLHLEPIEQELIEPQGDESLDQIRLQIAEMIQSDAAQLVATMWKLRRVMSKAPPLTGAFACLAVAELLMINTGLPIAEAEYAYLRKLAVALGEGILRGQANIVR